MRDTSIKKVLMIGSGPIVIGQAAEFDYAGTQACRSLKEEGVEVVLLNSNPATIMTDKDIADHVYIEPLTVDVLEKLIEKENVPIASSTVQIFSASRFSTTMAEWMSAVPVSQGMREAFSTGSQNQ